jgi:uncharacterized repeat protein (TIGR01451 family)
LTGNGFTVSPDIVYVVDSSIVPGQVLSTNPAFGASALQGSVVALTVSKAPDQVSVPDVTGQAADAAKGILVAEPYTFDVTVTSEPSVDVPLNNVLRTDPAVNTPVAKGAKVNLIVSAGPAKVRVPPVEGLTEAAARNQLTIVGLAAKVIYVNLATGSADDGHVISQSIPPTDSVLPGTTITLRVGKAAPAPTTTTSTTTIPPTTTTVPVPDLGITITDGQTSVAHNATVSYTIVATNNGASDVASAIVTDFVPSGLGGPISWTCTGSGGATCAASGTGNINTTVDLPAGGWVTFTMTGTVTASAGSTLSNTASVSRPGGVVDPAPSNDTATDSDTVTA